MNRPNNPLLSMFGSIQNFQQQFSQFTQQIQQAGTDPRQAVTQLMQNGQMSQQQFNQFSQIASMLTGRRPF